MESVWQKMEYTTRYPSLKKNIETDVLVIGGGMAGILCARKLQAAGKRVVLVEANRIGSGITARTTAVLTAQQDYLYQDMIRDFGEDAARAYLHAGLNAVAEYRKLSEKIPCDFETLPSMQYTANDPARLEKEVHTVRKLGFSALFTDIVPLPVLGVGAAVYPDMGQFHPLKFLIGAAEGLEIYENSRVLELEGTTAKLEQGSVQAKKIIVATHFPFINRRGLYFMKLYQRRSYVLALENASDLSMSLTELEGLGLYFRTYGELLLMGGGDHRTGKKGGGFAYLRAIARKYFPQSKERFAWANQDCVTLDGLPYVGEYAPNMPGVYVITGFNGWGMTNAMVGANLLTDMITGKDNPLREVLAPNRSVMHKQLWCNLGATALDFAIPTKKRCPHLGCALRWNSAEHSWDCPCHGSRFGEEGKLLDTPAQKDAEI